MINDKFVHSIWEAQNQTKLLSSLSLLSPLANTLATMIKNVGDKGSPCLRPQVDAKKS